MPNMERIFLAIAAFFGGSGVAAGAFAAHALRGAIGDRALEIFTKGTTYQMYHALALLLVALLLLHAKAPRSLLAAAGIAFAIGVVIFSGSLYAIALSGIPWWGAIAPIGGTSFLIGWGCLFVSAFRWKA